MSAHSENVKAMLQWMLVLFAGPHAKTVPLGALDALVERTESDSGFLLEIRDRLPVAGGASEATLRQVRDYLSDLKVDAAGTNAWLESLLDDQHGADLLIKLEAVRALLAGTLSVQAGGTHYQDSTVTLAGGATFIGVSRAVPFKELRGLAVADAAGTLHLEVSATGAGGWMRIASEAAAQVGGAGLYVASVTHAPVLPYARWVYVNGGGAQTLFALNTALVAA